MIHIVYGLFTHACRYHDNRLQISIFRLHILCQQFDNYVLERETFVRPVKREKVIFYKTLEGERVIVKFEDFI